jgi:hypothetical protein
MTQEDRIYDAVEKTLQAFDELPPPEADPALRAKIEDRLFARPLRRARVWSGGAVLRPVALALLIAANTITLIYVFTHNSRQDLTPQLISSLRSEYDQGQPGDPLTEAGNGSDQTK